MSHETTFRPSFPFASFPSFLVAVGRRRRPEWTSLLGGFRRGPSIGSTGGGRSDLHGGQQPR